MSVSIVRTAAWLWCGSCGGWTIPGPSGECLWCEGLRPAAVARGCDGCGVSFTTVFPQKRYHSAACRKRAHAQRKKRGSE